MYLTLFNIIKEKSKILILISISTIILTILFITYSNKHATFTAKTEIDQSRNLNFEAKNVENIMNSIDEKDEAFVGVTNLNFFQIYLSVIDREVVLKILKEQNFIDKDDYADENKYEIALNEMYRKDFVLYHENKNVDSNNWFINFTGDIKNLEKWTDFLIQFKKETSLAYNEKVMNELRRKKNTLNTILDNKINKLLRQRDYILNENFDYNTRELIEYLTEQASIARKLDIDNGISYILDNTENVDSVNLNDKRGAEFLNFQWGYLAIETKLKEIMKRSKSDAKFYAIEYSSIADKIFELQNSKLYHNTVYQDLTNNLSLTSQKNIEVDYIVINATKYRTNKVDLHTMITLSIIFGIIFNVIYLSFIMANHKNKI